MVTAAGAKSSIGHRWSQRRYLRAAYTIYQDRTVQPQAVVPAAVLRRPDFTHALARLTSPQRQIVRLRYFEGYPRGLAVDAMGCSITAVRLLECAALRRLHAECDTVAT